MSTKFVPGNWSPFPLIIPWETMKVQGLDIFPAESEALDFEDVTNSPGSSLTLPSSLPRKVNLRLPGKGNAIFHGARPVHLIITMVKWIRTSRSSIKYSPFSTLARPMHGMPQVVSVRMTVAG